jgi:hypothetical protein
MPAALGGIVYHRHAHDACLHQPAHLSSEQLKEAIEEFPGAIQYGGESEQEGFF